MFYVVTYPVWIEKSISLVILVVYSVTLSVAFFQYWDPRFPMVRPAASRHRQVQRNVLGLVLRCETNDGMPTDRVVSLCFSYRNHNLGLFTFVVMR